MNTDVHPPISAVRRTVRTALAEDLEPLGDISCSVLGVVDSFVSGEIVSRDEGLLAGRLCAVETFRQVDESVQVEFHLDDGEECRPGARVASISGPLTSVLSGERTALNFLGHLSGIATFTRRHVRAVHGHCQLLDTRKTTPGLRALEKAAVRAGGGFNHRGSLSDGVMFKDNHIARLGISEAVRRARLRWPGRPIHVECDGEDQVTEALEAGVDRVMLDNMSPEQVARCVELVNRRCEVEVTGGVDLRTLGDFAEAGPDFVSVGALTHSAPVLDLGLDLLVESPT